jgi:hypothetical protein
MSLNVKFYKLRLLKKFLEQTSHARNILMNELIDNASDPTIYLRRVRMLKHLAQYERQIIEKIQNFDSDHEEDFCEEIVIAGLQNILNKSA